MRKALLLIGVALAGAAAGAVGATYVSAQNPAQVTRTELLRKPITGIEGKEVIVFVADVPPGAVAGRHAHPGDEAIYMLQGALRFQPEGERRARTSATGTGWERTPWRATQRTAWDAPNRAELV